MKRVLVLEYSQSGTVRKVADAFCAPLAPRGVAIHRERLQPLVDYPYPWGGPLRLYSVFPECFAGRLDGIRPPAFQPDDRFDLVILAYQVWHLAPSIPIQSFLRSAHARVLVNTPVITLCVCRNMWQSASETMKRSLLDLGAIHIDNVVVTHQGPPFSTFVSVPRALISGKRDRFGGIFPPADLSADDMQRVERLGSVVAARLDDLRPPYSPVLSGQGAVRVNTRYIAPELFGWYVYRGSAGVITRATSPGTLARRIAILGFTMSAMLVILFGIPLCIVIVFALRPFLHDRIQRYARRLAEPST